MPEPENHSLIVPSGSGLARVEGAGRVIAEMVSDAIMAARANTSLIRKFKLGEYEFCEPDCKQILTWAKALRLEPEIIVQRLLGLSGVPGVGATSRADWATKIEGGRIIKLALDLALLPLSDLEWAEGLVIRELNLFVRHRGDSKLTILTLPQTNLDSLAVGGMHLSRFSALPTTTVRHFVCVDNNFTELELRAFPNVIILLCNENELRSLSLSSVPELEILDCEKNQLQELDLSHVPHLRSLWCRGNNISELDIRPLMHLSDLKYDSDTTRLIQRPEQCFPLSKKFDYGFERGQIGKLPREQHPEPLAESLFRAECSFCQHKLFRHAEDHYECMNAECGLRIPKVIAGRFLKAEEAKSLIETRFFCGDPDGLFDGAGERIAIALLDNKQIEIWHEREHS